MALFIRPSCRRMFRASLLAPVKEGLENYYKTSTGLVGLDVNPNARQDLIKQQKEMLERIQKIPSDAVYRQTIEKLANWRLETALRVEDPEKLEEELDFGQLEEILEAGERELMLIDEYAEWKFWEHPMVKQAVQASKEREAAGKAAAEAAAKATEGTDQPKQENKSP